MIVPPAINISEKELTRKERTNLAQLRSGHCRLLGSYKSRISKDVSLDVCDKTPNDVKHLFNCQLIQLENKLSEITDTFRNNTTFIWGDHFNAWNIDWETGGLVSDDPPNRLKEKLIEVISEARLQRMQREPTRGQNLLDLFCCNKPLFVKACISITGISDHSIVLADCDLRATINNKLPRKVYQWSKAD